MSVNSPRNCTPLRKSRTQVRSFSAASSLDRRWLSSRGRRRLFGRTDWELQDARSQTGGQISHQNDPAVGELQSVMMLGRLVQIDLPKSSQAVLYRPAAQHALNKSILFKSNFGAWTKANSHPWVRRGREASGPSPEKFGGDDCFPELGGPGV